MRTTALLFALLSAHFIHAQFWDTSYVIPSANLSQRVDTLPSRLAFLPFDPMITSYTFSAIRNGLVVCEQKITTPLYYDVRVRTMLDALQPGDKVIYSEIRKQTPNGGTTRLKDVIYIIGR